MKQLRIILLFVVLLTSGLAFSSCGSGGTNNATDTEKQGKEYTSAYVCPMHCAGSGSDAAGTCPVCGMDYVKNTDHNTDEHGHEGHNH